MLLAGGAVGVSPLQKTAGQTVKQKDPEPICQLKTLRLFFSVCPAAGKSCGGAWGNYG
jgi:hypothetical protein